MGRRWDEHRGQDLDEISSEPLTVPYTKRCQYAVGEIRLSIIMIMKKKGTLKSIV